MPRPLEDTPPVNSATMRAFVHWIRAAAPYVHAFRGKTFVIAFGGEVVADDSFIGVVHDINLLVSLGIRLVVVHGAGRKSRRFSNNRRFRVVTRTAFA
jgi:amino-acid N-acetyltransferase